MRITDYKDLSLNINNMISGVLYTGDNYMAGAAHCTMNYKWV